jgi:hypothetical protein
VLPGVEEWSRVFLVGEKWSKVFPGVEECRRMVFGEEMKQSVSWS